MLITIHPNLRVPLPPSPGQGPVKMDHREKHSRKAEQIDVIDTKQPKINCLAYSITDKLSVFIVLALFLLCKSLRSSKPCSMVLCDRMLSVSGF